MISIDVKSRIEKKKKNSPCWPLGNLGIDILASQHLQHQHGHSNI